MPVNEFQYEIKKNRSYFLVSPLSRLLERFLCLLLTFEGDRLESGDREESEDGEDAMIYGGLRVRFN